MAGSCVSPRNNARLEGKTMEPSFKKIFAVITVLWVGLLASDKVLASGADMKTPEGAVTAYLEGVAQQDFDKVVAASAADRMSVKFDFAAYAGRTGAILKNGPLPANHGLFTGMNKAKFDAQLANGLQVFVYSLMTREFEDANSAVLVDDAEAVAFIRTVQADRLKTISIIKIGSPKASGPAHEAELLKVAQTAKVYGADELAERLALISFEGETFVTAFTLLRYGGEWAVMGQYANAAAVTEPGIAARVNTEDFETLLD